MPGERDDWPAPVEEAVGYGRPPSWTRFKPGQSGNPKGRPKKPTAPSQVIGSDESPSDAILRAELAKKRRYKEGGEIKFATTSELLTRSTAETALKGNPLAQRELDRQRRELEKRDQERRRHEEKASAEQFERMVQYRDYQTRAYAGATSEQLASFELGPHPDDILLDHSKKIYKVRGPIGPDDLPQYEYYAAERDVFYLRAVVRWRTCRMAELKNICMDELIWYLWEELLPQRWRYSEESFASRDFWIRTMPMRKLRKHLRTAEDDAAVLRPRWQPAKYDREVYRKVNTLMKPFLKSIGYRSLAHLEHECAAEAERAEAA